MIQNKNRVSEPSKSLTLEKSDLHGEQIKILTLGDSVTFGGWGLAENSYPAVLSELLDESNKGKYHVTNNGMCGNTSTSVLNDFNNYIKVHRPNIIVLLIGAANRYRFEDYKFNQNDITTGKEKFYKSLRVYKVYDYIVREITSRYLESSQLESKDYYNIEKMWIKYNVMNEAKLLAELSKFKEEVEYNKSIKGLLEQSYILQRLSQYDEAENFLIKAQKLDPKSSNIRSHIGFFYSRRGSYYNTKGKPRIALKSFVSSVLKGPNNGDYLSLMMKPLLNLYKKQSIISSDEIREILLKKLEIAPKLRDNKQFMGYLWYFKNSDNQDKKISDWIKGDLEKIIKISKDADIQLILQNYHVSYHLANKVLEDMAEKHNLPIVNNSKAFNQLIKTEEDRSRLIKDDDHCTNEGHKIMANNVLKVIKSLQL
jgi:lysophospholipase L1-like esterase